MNVAIFTDNDFSKVNGVTTTLKAVLAHVPADVDARIYTCGDEAVESSDYVALQAHGMSIPFYPDMTMYFPPFRRFLRRAIADRIDLVHFTTPGPVGLAAMYVASKLGLPMVGSFHTDLAEYTRVLSGSIMLGDLMREYMRWPYGKCSQILVPSEATRQTLIDSQIDETRIRIWKRGVSADRFTPARRSSVLRESWGVDESRLALLYVGRVSREKGLAMLAPLCERLRKSGVDHQLIVAGDGPMRGELETTCPDAIFTGLLSADEVADTMAASDIFVFPSRTETAAAPRQPLDRIRGTLGSWDRRAGGEHRRVGALHRDLHGVSPARDASGRPDRRKWIPVARRRPESNPGPAPELCGSSPPAIDGMRPCGPSAVIKTVHLTNSHHESSGGIRTFYHALMHAASAHRRHIRLIVPGAQSGVEDVNDYARIYRVAAPSSPFIDRRYRLLLPNRILFGTGPIWSILREEKPDLVEVCDKYSLIYLGGLIRAGWLGRDPRPAVSALTCERMDDNVATFLSASRIARRLSRRYMRAAYARQFDGHIAISRYTAEELDGCGRPVYHAPLGIDARAFQTAGRNDEQRRALFGRVVNDPRTVMLLYAGRLSAEKNLPLLAGTMRLLEGSHAHRFHLAVAGDGPQRDSFAGELEEIAPGRVQFLGHVGGHEALARLYANADVFVHPNPREPFGIAPLEAMAAGLPLVAPASGGILEYATALNAWLAAPTPAAFAAAVRHVIDDPGDRSRRTAEGVRTALRFDWPIVASRFFECYDRIHADSEACRFIGDELPLGRKPQGGRI
ncbi:MAG: glycosyltransferase [Vicinamibacterales bacterium]